MKQETKTPESPFTGGEWESSDAVYRKDSGNWMVIIKCYRPNGLADILTTVFGRTKFEAEANALLISEAKNMYEALQEYVKVINRTDAAKHYYGKLTENVEAILSRINKQP